MTKYREILRLKSLGFSDRNIAQSCGVSRNTVRRVIDKAEEMKISWPLDFGMTDAALGELLFPTEKSVTDRRLPDYSYIRKELLRNGVTKKLLWVEYCEECRQTGEDPLMYSQFCEYIRRDEQKRRATMHIPRKPGEQIEVDWAGDPVCPCPPPQGQTECRRFRRQDIHMDHRRFTERTVLLPGGTECRDPGETEGLQCQAVPEKGMQQAQSVSWGRKAITGTFACRTLRTGRMETSHRPVQLSHRSRRYVLLRALSVYQK